jgi:thioredoxin-like negative regulator of GroEL
VIRLENINDQQFVEETSKEQFTIIKFYTTWCPDCKNLDRFIGEIVEEHADKTWLSIDAERYQHIAEENEVRGIPSLLVYKGGKKVGHLHSKYAKRPAQVREFLDTLV